MIGIITLIGLSANGTHSIVSQQGHYIILIIQQQSMIFMRQENDHGIRM